MHATIDICAANLIWVLQQLRQDRLVEWAGVGAHAAEELYLGHAAERRAQPRAFVDVCLPTRKGR